MSNTITKSVRKNRKSKDTLSRRFSASHELTQAPSGWEKLESRQMMSAAPLAGAALSEFIPAHSASTVIPLVKTSSAMPAPLQADIGASWQNNPLAAQSSSFEITFSAVPSQQNSNSVIGLSNGYAMSWTSLATIVRFNSNNVIDVRNGNHYQADATMNYTAGTDYQFRMDINPSTHTYSVYVTPQGGTEVCLAHNYGFRTEQANTSALNNLSGYSTVGTAVVSDVVINQLAQPVSASWVNTPIATQTGGFTVTFDSTPSQQGDNTVIGVSQSNAGAYTDLAAIVRFNSNNQIDVRNGGQYQSDTAVNYVAGTSYHFRMVVDTVDGTYSVYVTPAGGSEVQIASNYAFRTEQANASSFSNLGAFSLTGSATMSNLTVTSTPVVVVAPSTPTITATAASSSEIDINWSLIGSAKSYIVQRSTDGITYSTIATVGAGTNSYSDTGLSSSTKYYYSISAANSAGQSNWSNVASQTTPAVSTANNNQASTGMPTVAECMPRVALTAYTGPLTFTSATTITGMAISGSVVIDCPAGQTVSFVDCQFNGQYENVQAVIHQMSGNISMDHCEVFNAHTSFFAGNNLTANWCDFHGSYKDGLETGNQILIQNSRIENYGYGTDGPHADGIQIQNTDTTVLNNVYFGCLHEAVAGSPPWTVCAVFTNPIAGDVDSVTLNGCYFSGGCNQPLLIGDARGNVTKSITVENCTFLAEVTGNGSTPTATGYQFSLTQQASGINVAWTNNVDANGNPV